MLVNSKYRLVGKASWSIAINISAEWRALTVPPGDAVQLADKLWFICADKSVSVEEMHYFMLGLKLVSDDIEKHKEGGGPVLVKAVDIDYNPTDYQPEGLMPAAACWAAEAFHFPKPEIIGQYDKERRKYAISVKPRIDAGAEDAVNPVESIKTSLERLQDAQHLLEQGQLVSATKGAGKVVRVALQRVARKRDKEHQQSGHPQPVSIEDLMVVLARSGLTVIPFRVKKHAVRVGSWYSDLQFGIRPPNRREAEEYLHSAEEVVTWANEVFQHDSV
jgi:HEPN domain-containing protein